MARDMKVMLTIGLKDMVTKGLDGLSKKLQTFEVRTQVLGGAMTAAGGAIVGGFVVAAKQAAAFGSEIADLQGRTNLSAEALTGLKYACEQTGAQLGNVQMGVKTLSTQAMQSLKSDTNDAALAFKTLGVSVRNSDGSMKTSEKLFFEVGNALRNVKDETVRTDIATKLLGRGGMMLMPIFNDAGRSLKDFMDEAKSLGLVLDQQTVNKLDDLDDAMAKVKAQTGVMGRIMAVIAVPVLLDLTKKISGLLASISKWSNAHPTLTKAILGTVGVLGLVMAALGPVLMALPGAIALWERLTAAQTRNAAAATNAAAANASAGSAAAGGGAAAGAGGLGGRLLGGLKGAGAVVKAAGATLLSIATGAVGAATAVVVGGAAILTALWAGIEAAFAAAWKRIHSTAGRAVLAVSATIGFLVTALVSPVGAITAAGNLIRKHWDSIGEAVRGGLARVGEWFAGLWQKVAEMPGEFYRAGVAMVQALIDGLKARWAALKSEFAAGLQSLRDMLPGSEPKSGPLRGLGASGAAGAQTFVQGFAAGVGSGSYSRGGGRGSVTQNVNITVNGANADPQEIARAVDQRLRGASNDLRFGYPVGAGV
jgi:hypothetical protein